MPEYTVLITDKNLNIVGDPIIDWTSIDVTLRFNEPGSGILTVPGNLNVRSQLEAGTRIVIIRDQETLIAGPVEKWLYERSDDGEKAGDGVITINFADDLAMIAARAVYPNPALSPAAQDIDHWTYTGNAEAALRALVNLNAGPGALTARRVPQLVLGALASVGTSVTVSADRMQPIGDVMRLIASVGGGLGFRTVQNTSQQIEFQVYAPADLTGSVRFSFGLGNLKYIGFETTAPTATAAIVGGQGEGSDRLLLERLNSTEIATWGRFEKLVSMPGGSPTADLEDAGDKVLADEAATVRVPTNISDTPDQRYGEHYGLGSKVSIETWPGEQVSDIVQTVHLQIYATSGEYVASTVGSQAAKNDPVWVQRLRAIDERLGKLERTVIPAVP